jgi:galactokinase
MNLIPAPAAATVTGADFKVTVPGRVNLIGEHTDYNGGWVLPMAIGRGIQMHVRRRREAVRVDRASPIHPGHIPWGRYAEGVLSEYRKLGWKIPGFEADITADLPAGGGLSSSAALEIATAHAVETLCQRVLPPVERALLCQRAEHDFSGVPCGIMDQFAITFARADQALLLDCNSQQMSHVELKSDSLAILVVNSGVKHALADGEYAKRRAECATAASWLEAASLRDISSNLWQTKGPSLPELLQRRVRHVISENERTLGFVAALKHSDWEAAGSLMYASHDSLATDYQVSCPELDTLVELARKIPGVYGCRMTGGGFGGCVVALIEKSQSKAAMEEFEQQYKKATALAPTLFLTNAVAGPKVTPLR